MKQIMMILLLAVGLMFSGCAKREMTAFDVQIAASQSASRIACYDKQSSMQPDMKEWTPEQILSYQNTQTLKDAMKIIGKVPLDPCSTETNVYDAEKAVAQENSKQAAVVGAWGEKLLSSALMGWGIYEAADVLKTISKNGGITLNGDGNSLEGTGNHGNGWSFNKPTTTTTTTETTEGTTTEL